MQSVSRVDGGEGNGAGKGSFVLVFFAGAGWFGGGIGKQDN